MSHPRHIFSLRFHTRGTERHFVDSQSEQLLRSFCRLAFLGAALCAFMLPAWLATQAATTGDPRVIRTQQIAITLDLAGMFSFTAAGLAANSPMIYKRVSPAAREVAAVLLLTLLIPLPFLISKFYCPTLLGYNPHDIWEDLHLSDTRPILGLALCITGSHFAMPARWVILFPLEVFSVVVYAFFAFAVGGPDGAEAWSTLVLYGGMVLFSALGRRAIEQHQRDALAQLITERQLRAETEFRMAEMEQSSPLSGPRRTEEDQPAYRQDVLSTRESRAETTPSAQAFVSASQGGDLRSVMEVGKQEQWLIAPEEVKLMPKLVLGRGGFGSVVVGYYVGAPVAVKRVQEVSFRQESLASIINEIRVLRRLRHPSIVSYYGACLDIAGGRASVILEWVRGPSLEKFILQGGLPNCPITVAVQLKAISDICWAVSYLHSRQPSVVHGDLKGTNVVMERDPCRYDCLRAKLLDFGLSRVLTRHVGRLGGTPMWIAPEVAQSRTLPANVGADVFSFGRLAFFVLTGAFPFGPLHSKRAILEILRSGRLPSLPWPSASRWATEDCRGWIEACSAGDPSKRPRMAELARAVAESLRKAVRRDAKRGQAPEAASGVICDAEEKYAPLHDPPPEDMEAAHADQDEGAPLHDPLPEASETAHADQDEGAPLHDPLPEASETAHAHQERHAPSRDPLPEASETAHAHQERHAPSRDSLPEASETAHAHQERHAPSRDSLPDSLETAHADQGRDAPYLLSL